jgi:hypothetical protein
MSAVQHLNQSGSHPSIQHCSPPGADSACQLGHRLLLAAPGATLRWHGHRHSPSWNFSHTFGRSRGRAGALGKLRHTVAARAALVLILRAIGAHWSKVLDAGAAAAGHCGAGRYRAGRRLQLAAWRICTAHKPMLFKQPSGTGWFRHFALHRCSLRHAERRIMP